MSITTGDGIGTELGVSQAESDLGVNFVDVEQVSFRVAELLGADTNQRDTEILDLGDVVDRRHETAYLLYGSLQSQKSPQSVDSGVSGIYTHHGFDWLSTDPSQDSLAPTGTPPDPDPVVDDSLDVVSPVLPWSLIWTQAADDLTHGDTTVEVAADFDYETVADPVFDARDELYLHNFRESWTSSDDRPIQMPTAGQLVFGLVQD